VDNDCLVRIADQQLIVSFGNSATFSVGAEISLLSESCFAGNDQVQRVVFDANTRVQSLPAFTFSQCAHLCSITIPESVLAIGEKCFEHCCDLSTVSFEFPARIRRIDSEAFCKCYRLTSFTVPSSVSTLGKYVFLLCRNLSSVTFQSPSNLTDIPDELFYYCPLLTSLCLPDSLVKIAGSAFISTSLHSLTGRDFTTTDSLFFMQFEKVVRCLGTPKSIVIPSAIRQIGESAFAYVSSLVDLIFEEGLERIKRWAFSNCYWLKAVSFPVSLAAIDKRAFYCCFHLREVTLAGDSKLQCIGKEAFSGCRLE
jgi:hypothetical protein